MTLILSVFLTYVQIPRFRADLARYNRERNPDEEEELMVDEYRRMRDHTPQRPRFGRLVSPRGPPSPRPPSMSPTKGYERHPRARPSPVSPRRGKHEYERFSFVFSSCFLSRSSAAHTCGRFGPFTRTEHGSQ